MDFETMFEQVKKSVKKAVKITVKTSSDAIDYSKCKIKIAGLKSRIEDNYTKIGEGVYNKNVCDVDVDTSELEKWCNEITQWKEEIEKLNASVSKDGSNEASAEVKEEVKAIETSDVEADESDFEEM